MGDRGERAGPADVGHDGADARRGLHGRELVGRGPARRPRNLSQPGLQVEPVHLDHGSVDLEGQAVALPFQRGDRVRHVGHVRADAGVRHGFQSPAGQGAAQVPIGRGNGAFDCAHAVAEEVERAGRGDGRVELFERARGSVARVGEQRFFGLGAPVVQLPERGFGKEDFAAHFEPRRWRFRPLGEQGQRNRADGLQVGGDVFARDAVPARRTDGERAARIDQLHGHAVDFWLGHVLDWAVRFQEAQHALVKFLHLLLGGDVAERQHGQAVPHLAELGQRRGADFPGGRRRVGEVGMRGLQVGQAAEEPVVLRVADDRVVQDVVTMIMEGYFFAQMRDFLPHRIGRNGAGRGFALRDGRRRGSGFGIGRHVGPPDGRDSLRNYIQDGPESFPASPSCFPRCNPFDFRHPSTFRHGATLRQAQGPHAQGYSHP